MTQTNMGAEVLSLADLRLACITEALKAEDDMVALGTARVFADMADDELVDRFKERLRPGLVVERCRQGLFVSYEGVS